MNGIFDLDTYRECKQASKMRAAQPEPREPAPEPVYSDGPDFLEKSFAFLSVDEWKLARSNATQNERIAAREAGRQRDYLILTSSHRRIIREVAEKHGFTYSDIVGPRRMRALIKARQEAYCRVYAECPWMSLPQIGRAFGGRDHSTVIHGLRASGVNMRGALQCGGEDDAA